jgi:late competence protein required for DNA uptake (superfamily II DNA/RNA helicase)
MDNKKTLSVCHVYFIDEIGGFPYVADRKLVMGRFRAIVENHPEYIIVAENYFGDYESRRKYYKSKEAALKVLDRK